MTSTPRPIVLVVFDGWGEAARPEGNAIRTARTPIYQALRETYPSSLLTTCGEAVGLPAGQMGNSEVGHMNLGAGRVVFQDLTRIDQAIADGALDTNVALSATLEHCVSQRRALHLVGLVSNGGVHSHQRHLEALVRLAARRGVERVFVHAFTDGRDTAPTGGSGYLATLDQVCRESGRAQIASICGRYHAMDRDKRWERTQRAYDAIVSGIGTTGTDPMALVAESYANEVTDEFVEPSVVVDERGTPIGRPDDDDAVIFFNYRADRARQLTRALAFDDFDGFTRSRRPRLRMLTLTEYDATFSMPVAFPPQAFSGNLADVLSQHGRTNLRLAETEKYAHVTYFFNCGEEAPTAGEERILVPSPRVPTYDLQPEMSAAGITDHLVADLKALRHDVIICNFANADMVGHTGDMDATVAAVESLDQCLERIVSAVLRADATLLVTADHGNAEQMWDEERGGPHTAHTTNPVPVLMVGQGLKAGMPMRNGSLRDVAPTMLGVLGILPPAQMTGRDLREWS